MEKLLQREGKTAIKLDDLASQLGFKSAEDLFEVVGKDEFSLRNIETCCARPSRRQQDRTAPLLKKAAQRQQPAQGGVLVVGVDSLHDAAGQVLQTGAAGRDPRLCHARQGRQRAPHRLHQPARNGRQKRRARDRGRMGPAQGRRRPVYPVDVAVEAPTARACCATSPRSSPRKR